MTIEAGPSRLERRKAATRAALIAAAQTFLAEGRTSVSIADIAEAADVGTGSFYNHFETKDELFAAATEAALELHGAAMDQLGSDLDDPAEVFARSFRITGRFHRQFPELSKVLINSAPRLLRFDSGLGPRARRDLEVARDAGRFTADDLDAAMLTIGGSALALGVWIHDHPDEDDAARVDQVTADLLRLLGLSSADAADVVSRPLPD